MQRALETAYACGRLAFGGGLMAAPEAVAGVLLGDQAREPLVRIAVRSYGTRDLVLGLGTLGTVAMRGDTAPWIRAGIASDVLDTVVQVLDWDDLPPGKRLPGILSAVGAAAVGVGLLARR